MAWNTRPQEKALSELVSELAEALSEARDDVADCMEDDGKWHGLRQDRVDMRREQLAKIDELLERVRK